MGKVSQALIFTWHLSPKTTVICKTPFSMPTEALTVRSLALAAETILYIGDVVCVCKLRSVLLSVGIMERKEKTLLTRCKSWWEPGTPL